MAIYDIIDFGAVGDGKTNDVQALQHALEAHAVDGLTLDDFRGAAARPARHAAIFQD